MRIHVLMELTNLNAKQLKQVISEASSALNRRQKVEKRWLKFSALQKNTSWAKKSLEQLLSRSNRLKQFQPVSLNTNLKTAQKNGLVVAEPRVG